MLQTDRYRLEIAPETGAIASLYDRIHGLQVFSGPAALPVLVHDRGNAWGSRKYDEPCEHVAFLPEAVTISQRGPLAAALRVEYVLARAGARTSLRLTQEFWLYEGLGYIDVHLSLLWNERGLALKLAFPVFIKQYPEATVEIPHAAQMYVVDGTQVPGLAWADATGESNFTERGEKLWHGVTLANTGRYSYSFEARQPDQTVLSMLVARGNTFTYPPSDGSDAGFALEDEGLHRLWYRIVPHVGGWREAGSYRAAVDLNRPPLVMAESLHPGRLPLSASVLSISHPNVVLGSLKPAVNGDGLIVRFYEAQAEQTRDVEISLLDRSWRADFRPYEIKSFRLETRGEDTPVEVDLLERSKALPT
jgi:alpha-mannosidase